MKEYEYNEWCHNSITFLYHKKSKQTKDLANWSRPRKHGHRHDNTDILEKLEHKTEGYNIN